MSKLLPLSACVFLVCIFTTHSARSSTYQIHELQLSAQGTAGLGCTGWINASSGSGILAGAGYDSGVCHAAVSDSNGDMTLFGAGFALGVNSLGQAVGYSGGAATWDAAGNLTMLPLLPDTWFSQARAINDSGIIVGESAVGTTVVNDCITLWNGLSTPIILGQGYGNAINAGGSVAGYTKDSAGTHSAFVWTSSGGMTSLSGGTASEANAINNSGQAAGIVCDAGSAWACMWEADGTLRLLPNLAGTISSTAWDVNGSGAVVGSCNTTGGTFAVLWEPNGTIVNLGALPDNTSSVAYAISDSFKIAGVSMDSTGIPHAVAWSAVPEPTGLLALIAGLALLLPRMRKR